MAIRNPGSAKQSSAQQKWSSSLEGAPRILLVDDNANGLSARKCVLEELGYQIQTASSGAEALAKFQAERANNPFHLVVTDYKMPRMDGLELIRQLREHTAQDKPLGIIMISGYTDALGLDENSTGADAVIQKSSNEVSHLVRAVSRLLKQRSTSKAKAAPAAVPAKKPASGATAPLARVKSQGT